MEKIHPTFFHLRTANLILRSSEINSRMTKSRFFGSAARIACTTCTRIGPDRYFRAWVPGGLPNEAERIGETNVADDTGGRNSNRTTRREKEREEKGEREERSERIERSGGPYGVRRSRGFTGVGSSRWKQLTVVTS